MNSYSLLQLRKILFQIIDQLMEIDSYWRKCTSCKNNGRCCIGADISIREDEWTTIKDFIRNLSIEDKIKLKHNINNNIFCPFRTENKCIIHAVRPMNCIWTPYQLAQNVNTNEVMYSMIDNNCNCKNITIHSTPLDKTSVFVQADSFNEKRVYLFLNHFIINYEQSEFKYQKISEIINQVQL